MESETPVDRKSSTYQPKTNKIDAEVSTIDWSTVSKENLPLIKTKKEPVESKREHAMFDPAMEAINTYSERLVELIQYFEILLSKLAYP